MKGKQELNENVTRMEAGMRRQWGERLQIMRENERKREEGKEDGVRGRDK